MRTLIIMWDLHYSIIVSKCVLKETNSFSDLPRRKNESMSSMEDLGFMVIHFLQLLNMMG